VNQGQVLAAFLVGEDVQVPDYLAVAEGASQVSQLKLGGLLGGTECNGEALHLYEFEVSESVERTVTVCRILLELIEQPVVRVSPGRVQF